MLSEKLNILLADDDKDDCLLFEEAIKELSHFVHLSTVPDGEQLMQLLTQKTYTLPHVLFLDLNMPRKNGFECLCEIKQNKKLKDLAVVMFSTSFPRDKTYEQEMINVLLKIGAQNYIRKPNNFEQLKQAILQVITAMTKKKFVYN